MNGSAHTVFPANRRLRRALRAGSDLVPLAVHVGSRRPPGPQAPNRNTNKPLGQVAQLVEHRTENPSVGGSNPPLTTNKNPPSPAGFGVS